MTVRETRDFSRADRRRIRIRARLQPCRKVPEFGTALQRRDVPIHEPERECGKSMDREGHDVQSCHYAGERCGLQPLRERTRTPTPAATTVWKRALQRSVEVGFLILCFSHKPHRKSSTQNQERGSANRTGTNQMDSRPYPTGFFFVTREIDRLCTNVQTNVDPITYKNCLYPIFSAIHLH